MFKNYKKEEENNNIISDRISLEQFLKNSKEIFKEIKPIYINNDINKKGNNIFKYLSHINFGIYIIPFLNLKDILSLRAASKEINLLINSNIICINYYIKTLKKYISFTQPVSQSPHKNKFSSQLKPFHELNDESEFIEQKNILNEIKKYMKSPNFSLDYLMQIYRVEMDYLKYEENHQERYMTSLMETRKKINEEYQLIKGKSKKKESWANIDKEGNVEKNIINEDKLKEMTNEELKKKIQELKIKKENILFKLNNAKKTNEELNYRNNEKKKIINKLIKLSKLKESKLDPENDNDNDNDENGDLEEVKNFLINN